MARRSTAVRIVHVLLACCMSEVEGSLRGAAVIHEPPVDQVLAPLALALSTSGGPAEVEVRVAKMMEALGPVYLALPRSADGYLEAAAVRYLLHRYFIDKDGWFVQGSDSSGEVATSALPEELLKDSALARSLSEQLAARGLSLREAAVLAVGLETLAARETVERLHAAYNLLGVSEVHAKEDELWEVLKVYMQMYTMGTDYDTVTMQQVNEIWEKIYTAYPTWDELMKWLREVRAEVLAGIPEQRYSFEGQLRVFEELQHRYGRWQDQECLSIKEALLHYVRPGTGRVPLSTFYMAHLPGGWKPSESKDYLAEMGALDETDPSSPSVVIPNYFDTPSNCARPSKYYSVCCISECEALLGHLERKLGSPDAAPKDIIDVVEKLPSGSIDAPRTLPAQLAKRLESVAEMHGGHVPMHGRLFRQWMHHAFPAECSFPALSSTKRPMSQADFQESTGISAWVTEEALSGYLEDASAKAIDKLKDLRIGKGPAERVEAMSPVLNHIGSNAAYEGAFAAEAPSEFTEELPWSDEEELFIVCPAEAEITKARSFISLRAFIFVAGVGSMLFAFAQGFRTSKVVELPRFAKLNMA